MRPCHRPDTLCRVQIFVLRESYTFLTHAVATLIHGCKQSLFLEHAQILYLKKTLYAEEKKNQVSGNRSLDPNLVKLKRYHLRYLGGDHLSLTLKSISILKIIKIEITNNSNI